MGAYYQAVCDEVKERIDPGYINGLGIKAGSIAHPKHPFGQIVMFAMVSRWRSVRLIDDGGSDDDAYDNYKDVTEEVLKAYNERYGTAHQHRARLQSRMDAET